MVEARQRDQWDHTAMLLALFANANRNPDERPEPFTFQEFHPFECDQAAEPADDRIEIQDFSLLKSMLRL